MQTFAKLNLPLILGSDFPVERPSVFEGIWSAVTRTSASEDLSIPGPAAEVDVGEEGGVLIGGKRPFFPEEVLTLKQALHGFTTAPAYGAFWETEIGKVEKGMWADWVVIDGEIKEDTDVRDLKGVGIVETWVGGRRVWCRDCEEEKREKREKIQTKDNEEWKKNKTGGKGNEKDEDDREEKGPVGEGWTNDANEERFDL
jgi:predicted amidohydrolase YtcJ